MLFFKCNSDQFQIVQDVQDLSLPFGLELVSSSARARPELGPTRPDAAPDAVQPRRQGDGGWPRVTQGADVIKLFTAVSYDFS